MNTRAVSRLAVLAALLLPAATAAAASLPGAIFTTTSGGTIVNEDVRYDAKIVAGRAPSSVGLTRGSARDI